jgi:ribosomal protein S15P/S13E
MNLYRVESQLSNLERLVPHLTQHGCDISAQDAARALMRYFDKADLSQEDKALESAYAEVRGRLKDIADGRSGLLTISKVAAITRFYREHMLRNESVMIRPVTLGGAEVGQLDS